MSRLLFVLLAFFVCQVAFGHCTIFVRGDVNSSGTVNATDVTLIAPCIFQSQGCPHNMDAVDVDDDGDLDMADYTYLWAFIYNSGPCPLPPFSGSGGFDNTPDLINCACDVIYPSNPDLESSLTSQGYNLEGDGIHTQWPYPQVKSSINYDPDGYVNVGVWAEDEKASTLVNIGDAYWMFSDPPQLTYGLLSGHAENETGWNLTLAVLIDYSHVFAGSAKDPSVNYSGGEYVEQAIQEPMKDLRVFINAGSNTFNLKFTPVGEGWICERGWYHYTYDCSPTAHQESWFTQCFENIVNWLFGASPADALELTITADDIIENWPSGAPTDIDTEVTILGVGVGGLEFNYFNDGEELSWSAESETGLELGNVEYYEPCTEQS